jgi:arylsulfatase A-like enzyme
MAAQPNVILICVDQWRGDCLSVAGHPVVHTPYLDQMALEGVRFSRAYSATPTCIPARAALYTGLSQRTHGRVGYQDGVPWDYPVTIAGEFTRHGYQTQAVGKLHVYPERSQIGFQNVILHDGFLHFARRRDRDYALMDDYLPWLRERACPDADYFDHGLNCNSQITRPWDKPEHLHPTNFIVTQAIDFLRRRDTRKPFFLYLGFHRPHQPYDPPAWAFEHYVDAEMPAPPVGDWVDDLLTPYATPHRPDLVVGELAPSVLRRARAGYYGHMTHIDHQINRFLEVLHEFRQRDNTYVCFVSDHGEMLGDHRCFRKSLPYEGSARVPLILKGPRNSGIPPGAARDELVELRDIMPTLLECAGLPIPDGVEGRSFLPFARGQDRPWRPHLHGEHIIFGQSLQWITDGHEKYVWWSGTGREQLFNLHDDPQERHDLARTGEAAGRLVHWRKVLIGELAGREEGFADGEGLAAGRPVRPVLAHLRRSAGLDD